MGRAVNLHIREPSRAIPCNPNENLKAQVPFLGHPEPMCLEVRLMGSSCGPCVPANGGLPGLLYIGRWEPWGKSPE